MIFLPPVPPKSWREPLPTHVWTIYRLPDGRYTVRRWACDGSTPDPVGDPIPLYSGPSLHDARCAVPGYADTCLHRCPDDDPLVVETWI